MSNRDEVDRLLLGPAPGQRPEKVVVQFQISSDGDAHAVLSKVKAIIEVMIRNTKSPFPEDDIWKALLPEWLIVQFISDEAWSTETKRVLTMTYAEKLKAARDNNRWSLGSWVYWFRPENREWRWFNGMIQNDRIIIVTVDAEDDPFSSDALTWLFRACGGTEVNS